MSEALDMVMLTYVDPGHLPELISRCEGAVADLVQGAADGREDDSIQDRISSYLAVRQAAIKRRDLNCRPTKESQDGDDE